MGGQQVSYTWVSSLDQNPDRQLGVAVDRTFTGTASGRSTARPQLEAMLAPPSGIVLDDMTIVGGPRSAYQGNTPGTSSRTRNWVQNGLSLPDHG